MGTSGTLGTRKEAAGEGMPGFRLCPCWGAGPQITCQELSYMLLDLGASTWGANLLPLLSQPQMLASGDLHPGAGHLADVNSGPWL